MPRVSLSQRPPAARFIFRGRAAAVAAGGAAFGVAFPEGPCQAAESSGRAALWLGPDEWLLTAPSAEREEILRDLSEALRGVAHALVEISDRQVAIVVAGEDAVLALSAGCPLDLDLAAFPVGACARTVLGKSEVVLWRRAEHSFDLEVWRSFADYLTAFLQEAASGLETA